MKGRFLLHYSDPTNWRLRNIDEHPFDPGWEIGSYSICHAQIRPQIDRGICIFDVVVRNEKAVIRSAFIIDKVRGTGEARILYFDEFYFADEDPIELPDPYIQYRCMKMETFIHKYNLGSLWQQITKKYTKYRKGQRPKSIDPIRWESMIQKSSLHRKKSVKNRSRCPSRKIKCK